MAYGAEIALIAGAVISATTTVVAAQNQADFAEDVALRNIMEERKDRSINREAERRKRIRRMGAARASFAASGVELTGTPLDVLGDMAFEETMGEMMADRESKARINSFILNASTAQSQARNQSIAAVGQAAGTILGAGGSAAFGSSGGNAGKAAGGAAAPNTLTLNGKAI